MPLLYDRLKPQATQHAVGGFFGKATGLLQQPQRAEPAAFDLVGEKAERAHQRQGRQSEFKQLDRPGSITADRAGAHRVRIVGNRRRRPAAPPR